MQHFLVAIIIYATGFLLDKFAQNNFFFIRLFLQVRCDNFITDIIDL